MLKKARDPVSWKWQIRAAKWHLSQLITCSYFWLLLFSSFVWWSATFSCAKMTKFSIYSKDSNATSHNDRSIRWNRIPDGTCDVQLRFTNHPMHHEVSISCFFLHDLHYFSPSAPSRKQRKVYEKVWSLEPLRSTVVRGTQWWRWQECVGK